MSSLAWGRRYLMCPPSHFGVLYEINPWMEREVAVDLERATSQWASLRQALVDAGATVEVLPAAPGLPDLVFTANAGLVSGGLFIPSRFRHPERQGEVPHDVAWFEARGATIAELPDEVYQEGAGDALPFGDVVIAGYRWRSDVASHPHLSRLTGAAVRSIELVDPRLYHLDLTFCPLDDRRAIVAPSGWDRYGARVVEELVPEPLVLEEDETYQFCANSVVVGSTIVMASCPPRVGRQLEAWGFEVVVAPVDEFQKAGGGCRCLTLALDVALGGSRTSSTDRYTDTGAAGKDSRAGPARPWRRLTEAVEPVSATNGRDRRYQGRRVTLRPLMELTGRQRAAAVLAQLDAERASRLLSRLSEAEAVALTTEVALLPMLDQAVLDGIVTDLRDRLGDFADLQAGAERAERLLRTRLGAARAEAIMAELEAAGAPRPLAFVASVDPVRLARFVESEHPQLVVVLLAHLRREQAGRVLDELDPDTRTEVTRRLVTMRPLSVDALQRLHEELEARMIALARRGDEPDVDGMTAVVDILTSADRPTEQQVLSGIEVVDPLLADSIRSRLFTFDDLVGLEPRSLQEVLRSVEGGMVALALKGKPGAVVERIMAAMTERRAAQLIEDLASLPPQLLHDVQDAESALVRRALALSEAGTITIERSDDPLLS